MISFVGELEKLVSNAVASIDLTIGVMRAQQEFPACFSLQVRTGGNYSLLFNKKRSGGRFRVWVEPMVGKTTIKLIPTLEVSFQVLETAKDAFDAWAVDATIVLSIPDGIVEIEAVETTSLLGYKHHYLVTAFCLTPEKESIEAGQEELKTRIKNAPQSSILE